MDQTFYHLTDPEDLPDSYYAEWDDEAIETKSIICPVNEGHQRASGRLNDLTIRLPSSKIGDFVWTWLSECIITDRVAQLFKEAGFTGYQLRPVKVSKVFRYHTEKNIGLVNGKPVGITKVTRDRNPKPIPPLWELVVTGFAGDAHPKSGIRLKEKCKACGSLDYTDFGQGLFIDQSKWDGSDFFTVWPLPLFIIVTERVKRLIEKHKLKNCRFTPTEELIGEGKEGGLGVDLQLLEEIKRRSNWKGKLIGE